MINYLRKFIWDLSSKTKTFKGKHRLVGLISRPKNTYGFKIQRQGVDWFLDGHDINEFSIAIKENHTPLVSKFLERTIQDKNIKVFWDIGANIGGISLPLLNNFKNLQAVLFEPSAEVAGRLIRNISMNPSLSSRATILNLALSDKVGLANFYTSNETSNSGVAGLGDSHNRFKFSVGVQAYTGDALIEKNYCPVPELIKIDVEGFELEVFKGLSDTLKKYHPIIIFEHSIYRLKERNLGKDEVTKYLESLGYKIFKQATNEIITFDDLNIDDDFVAKAL